MRPRYLVLFVILVFILNFPLYSPVIAETQEQKNLIAQKMIALDTAFKKTIDAVIFNKPQDIVAAYDDAKKIRIEANAALKEGKIKLQKNQNLSRRFFVLDRRFQKETSLMIRAARKNNMTMVKMQTHKMMDLCSQCHKIFKEEAQP